MHRAPAKPLHVSRLILLCLITGSYYVYYWGYTRLKLALVLSNNKGARYRGSKKLWTLLALLSIASFIIPILSLLVISLYGFPSLLIAITGLAFLHYPIQIVLLFLLYDVGMQIANLGKKKRIPIMEKNTMRLLLIGSLIVPLLISTLLSPYFGQHDGFSVKLLLGPGLKIIGPILWFLVVYETQSTLNDVLISEKKGTVDDIEKSRVPGFKIGAIVGVAYCVLVLGPIWIFTLTHELPGYGSDMAFLLIAGNLDFPAVFLVELLGINPWNPIGFILLIGANALVGVILGAACEFILHVIPKYPLRRVAT